MPIYLLHGEDDSFALSWLNNKKEAWLPPEWRPFNFHPFDSRKLSFEEFSNVLLAYPMGASYRVILLRELEKTEALRKKRIAELLRNVSATTMVILWFVPGPKDPKKIPLPLEWKSVLAKTEFIKCDSSRFENEASVFSFLDGLGERQISKAFKALKHLLLQGEAPLRLLAALTNQLRMLWQIQLLHEEGLNAQEISKKLEIHPYRITKGLKHSKNFKLNEFSKFFDWLSKADLSLKTGKQEPEHLLELLVLRFCKG